MHDRAHELLFVAAGRCARQLEAARPDDIAQVAAGIARLEELVGRTEAEELLRDGPLAILAGTLQD